MGLALARFALVNLADDRAGALRRALVSRACGNLLELCPVGDPLDRGRRRILELAVQRDAQHLAVIAQRLERAAPHRFVLGVPRDRSERRARR